MRSYQVQAAESSDGRVVSILYRDGTIHDKPPMHKQLWATGPMQAFLPEGYPNSVTADYASMCISMRLMRRAAPQPVCLHLTHHYCYRLSILGFYPGCLFICAGHSIKPSHAHWRWRGPAGKHLNSTSFTLDASETPAGQSCVKS